MINILKETKELLKRFLIILLPLIMLFTGIVGVIYFVETNISGSVFFNITSSLKENLKNNQFLAAKNELIIKLLYLYIVLISIAVTGSIVYARLYLTRFKSEEWRRKLSQAVEQSPNIVIITDKKGLIEYINPSFTKLTDYRLNELIGTTLPVFDLQGQAIRINKKPIRINREIFVDIISKGKWKGEVKSKNKKGEFFWIPSTISPIKNDAGEITHYAVISENNTDISFIEKKMTRLARAVESTVDGIIITDPDGKIEYMNQAIKVITGWKDEEIVGKDLRVIHSGLMPKEFFMQLSETHHMPGIEQIIMAEEFYTDIWKVLKKERAWQGQLIGRRKGITQPLSPEYLELHDPSIYWVQSTITPIFDKKEEILGYVVTQHEITKEIIRKEKINMQKEELENRLKEISILREQDERHLLEINMANEQLKMAMNEAYNAYRAKDEFLANVSHELRTPVIGISGMIDMLHETELRDEQREFVELAKVSADTLLSLINDILDFSKFQAGNIDLEIEPFNLKNMIKDTIKIILYRAKAKGLILTESISPKVPQIIKGDPIRLRQILINLLGNAIKFTEQGAVKFYLEVEDNNDERVRDPLDMISLHFSVLDTGIGISEENQKKIFKAFTQADGSTSRKYGGTGLGLTIASQLVEKMNGKMWVQSTIGHGSIFHFTTELQLCKDEEIREIETRDVIKAEPNALYEHAAAKKINVLVAEDNIVNQKFIKTLLQKKQYLVTIANNGKEALETFKTKHFDVILMDVHMPEMDGLETTIQIREHEKDSGQHVPIIAVTANTTKSDRDKCLAVGMDTFLPRPIKAANLFKIIDELLQNIEHLNALQGLGVQPTTINYQSKMEDIPNVQDNSDIFDKNAALESMLGDNDLLKEMTKKFLDRYNAQLDDISKSILSQDHSQLERTAHILKGSISHFFANRAYQAVLKLEELGKNNREMSLAKELFLDLQTEMTKLKTVLTEIVNE